MSNAGSWRTGAEARARLRAAMASSASGLHWNASLHSRPVRGGGDDDAEVVDELAVVTCQPQESAQAAYRSGLWPGCHDLHLVVVHGDAVHRDDVAQVGGRCVPKGTLGAFDEEGVMAQGLKYCLDMLQVGRPRVAVDKYVIKKDQNELAKEWPQDVIH